MNVSEMLVYLSGCRPTGAESAGRIVPKVAGRIVPKKVEGAVRTTPERAPEGRNPAAEAAIGRG